MERHTSRHCFEGLSENGRVSESPSLRLWLLVRLTNNYSQHRRLSHDRNLLQLVNSQT